MARIGKFNGSMWEQLANGISNGVVYDIDMDSKHNLYAVGTFTTAGGITVDRAAFWNGSAWTNLDAKLNYGTSVLVTPKDDVFIGMSSHVSVTNKWIASGITYVTNNGSAEVRPTIYIRGSAKLRYIENQTTGKKLWFNLNIIAGEEVFIDFGAGKFYSVVRGDLYYTILPGSDFHGFTLLPGENKIAMFMHDDVGALATIYYTPTQWSSDSTQPAEEY
jgi:hypothetical protein